jgi:hypothetical protein
MTEKDKQEKLEEIQGLVRGKKIVFAPQDKIRDLRPWVEQVLKAIGHPEAWVSNQSCVGDFGPDDEEMAQIQEALGIPVKGGDYIVDVAQRLKEKVTGRG